MKAVNTSCKSLGYTDQAAKSARQRFLAMMDFMGLNSLFLTFSPCDLCSFRVRLFAHPDQWVRHLLSFQFFSVLENKDHVTCLLTFYFSIHCLIFHVLRLIVYWISIFVRKLDSILQEHALLNI